MTGCAAFDFLTRAPNATQVKHYFRKYRAKGGGGGGGSEPGSKEWRAPVHAIKQEGDAAMAAAGTRRPAASDDLRCPPAVSGLMQLQHSGSSTPRHGGSQGGGDDDAAVEELIASHNALLACRGAGGALPVSTSRPGTAPCMLSHVDTDSACCSPLPQHQLAVHTRRRDSMASYASPLPEGKNARLGATGSPRSELCSGFSMLMTSASAGGAPAAQQGDASKSGDGIGSGGISGPSLGSGSSFSRFRPSNEVYQSSTLGAQLEQLGGMAHLLHGTAHARAQHSSLGKDASTGWLHGGGSGVRRVTADSCMVRPAHFTTQEHAHAWTPRAEHAEGPEVDTPGALVGTRAVASAGPTPPLAGLGGAGTAGGLASGPAMSLEAVLAMVGQKIVKPEAGAAAIAAAAAAAAAAASAAEDEAAAAAAGVEQRTADAAATAAAAAAGGEGNALMPADQDDWWAPIAPCADVGVRRSGGGTTSHAGAMSGGSQRSSLVFDGSGLMALNGVLAARGAATHGGSGRPSASSAGGGGATMWRMGLEGAIAAHDEECSSSRELGDVSVAMRVSDWGMGGDAFAALCDGLTAGVSNEQGGVQQQEALWGQQQQELQQREQEALWEQQRQQKRDQEALHALWAQQAEVERPLGGFARASSPAPSSPGPFGKVPPCAASFDAGAALRLSGSSVPGQLPYGGSDGGGGTALLRSYDSVPALALEGLPRLGMPQQPLSRTSSLGKAGVPGVVSSPLKRSGQGGSSLLLSEALERAAHVSSSTRAHSRLGSQF